jgi:hypothetical protein
VSYQRHSFAFPGHTGKWIINAWINFYLAKKIASLYLPCIALWEPAAPVSTWQFRDRLWVAWRWMAVIRDDSADEARQHSGALQRLITEWRTSAIKWKQEKAQPEHKEGTRRPGAQCLALPALLIKLVTAVAISCVCCVCSSWFCRGSGIIWPARQIQLNAPKLQVWQEA